MVIIVNGFDPPSRGEAAIESGRMGMNPSGYKKVLGFELRVVLFSARIIIASNNINKCAGYPAQCRFLTSTHWIRESQVPDVNVRILLPL